MTMNGTNKKQRVRPAARVGGALGAATLACAASGALASGFQIQEQSASGLGVAYAGPAGARHDASTVFWNPAGQVLMPMGVHGAAAGAFIVPSSRFRNDGGSTFGTLGEGGQGGERAFVPALYGSWRLHPDWAVGLAINAPFGLGTEWDATWAGQFHAVRSELQTLNLNPTVSWRIADRISIGAGISYQRLSAELTNRAVLAPPFPASVVGTGRIEGDDWGWGWNLGAMMALGTQTQLGVTYRSRIRYTLEGDLTFQGFPAAVPARRVAADVDLPETLSIGVSHRFDPSLRMLADWTWTGWDGIGELRVVDRASGATVTNTALGFRNSWRAGLGLEYAVNKPWLLRAGLAYDTTPVRDEYRTPRLPDTDRVWLSIGARYAPGPTSRWWLDVGYTHVFMSDGPSNLPYSGASAAEAARGALRGTYRNSVDILAAQVGVRF